jgi:site-specific DNA recombinase
MNCVLYARVSTDKQAEKELSIPAQQQAMRDFARQRGWNIVEEFVEPGASARTAERPELTRLLARCTSDAKPHVVLIHKIDRLARNVFDHATIRALLKQQGIKLASVVENVDESVSGELVENIMASIAQFYSANLSEEVKKGMRQKVMNGGWPHRAPRGYVIVKNGTSSNIEVHPTEGPLMKRAFEWYATGAYSVKTLAQRLAHAGLLSRSGGAIPQAHLRRLLAHSFYAGVVRWHQSEYRGSHPALISRELFDKVQRVIHQRFRNPGIKGSVLPGFLLRGLAVCSSCRGRMTGERHGRFRYYRCSRQTYRRDKCSGRACNVDRAHAELERVCSRIRMPSLIVEQIQKRVAKFIELRVTDDAIARNRRQVDEASLVTREMELADAFAAGDLAPNDFNREIATVREGRKRIAELSTNIAVTAKTLAEDVNRRLQLASSFWDVYEPLNEQRKVQLLGQLFDTIVLDHKGIAGFTLKAPYDGLISPRLHGKSPEELAAELVQAV